MSRQRPAEVRYYEWSVSRWRTSSTRSLLDAASRGIYRELLDACYTQGSILNPDKDPAFLQAICRDCGCTEEQFLTCWKLVRRHFIADKHDVTRLTNKQADCVRRAYFAYLEKQRENWSKRRQNETLPNKVYAGAQLAKTNELAGRINHAESEEYAGVVRKLKYNTNKNASQIENYCKIERSHPPADLPSNGTNGAAAGAGLSVSSQTQTLHRNGRPQGTQAAPAPTPSVVEAATGLVRRLTAIRRERIPGRDTAGSFEKSNVDAATAQLARAPDLAAAVAELEANHEAFMPGWIAEREAREDCPIPFLCVWFRSDCHAPPRKPAKSRRDLQIEEAERYAKWWRDARIAAGAK